MEISSFGTDGGIFNYCPVDGHLFSIGESQCPECQSSRYLNDYIHLDKQQSPSAERKRWRKLLYIKQDYPDNYVDHTFLAQMKKNANLKSYEYWSTAFSSLTITTQLSSIVLFVCLFVHQHNQVISVSFLVTFGLIASIAAYLFWRWSMLQILTSLPNHSVIEIKAIKATVLFIIILISLSPILKTLTQDTSDDTIYALTTVLFIMNLLFHDYGSSEPEDVKYPGSLSLNAAIFGSVLLASRLFTSLDVFGLMLFAVEWFGLFPIFRRSMALYKHGPILINLTLLISASLSLYPLSKLFFSLYLLTYVFITFVCPFWLIWIQRYKNEIKGPWDEVKVILNE